jgi:hypothetical protein
MVSKAVKISKEFDDKAFGVYLQMMASAIEKGYGYTEIRNFCERFAEDKRAAEILAAALSVKLKHMKAVSTFTSLMDINNLLNSTGKIKTPSAGLKSIVARMNVIQAALTDSENFKEASIAIRKGSSTYSDHHYFRKDLQGNKIAYKFPDEIKTVYNTLLAATEEHLNSTDPIIKLTGQNMAVEAIDAYALYRDKDSPSDTHAVLELIRSLHMIGARTKNQAVLEAGNKALGSLTVISEKQFLSSMSEIQAAAPEAHA